jgi:cystathionine beta-lyase/cystathionine gamma-synthase
VTFIHAGNADALRAAIQPNTRAIYIESPVNPMLEVIGFTEVAGILKEVNSSRPEDQRVYSICDNTFATPVCQRPIEHGIDIVVHSLTKGIGGFGTDMGGVVVAPEHLNGEITLYRKDFGGVLSAKAAWTPLVYGLPTLPIRMQRMQDSAKIIANFIHDHPAVDKVRYPGLPDDPGHETAKKQMIGYDGSFMPGNMIYFTLKEKPGSNARAEAFIDYAAEHSYCMTLAVSLGQIKTLIENPHSMTHSTIPPEEQIKAGIEAGGIRISIGIEDTDDLLGDLTACFEHVANM